MIKDDERGPFVTTRSSLNRPLKKAGLMEKWQMGDGKNAQVFPFTI